MSRNHAANWAFFGLGALALWGCQTSSQAGVGGASSQLGCTPNTSAVCACLGGTSGTQLCAADGTSYGACQCGAPLASGGGGPIPCDVRAVLETKCWSCHGAALNYTAPMHLTSAGDFAAASHSNPGVSVATQVKARTHSPDRPMPPPTMPQLTAAELATLDAWLDGGAVAGSQLECASMAAADGGTMGQAGMGGLPDAGEPDAAVDPEVECFDFLAHASGSQEPFPVPQGTSDLYNCFYFTPKWQGDLQGVSFKSKIDKTPVVHHWLLYQNATAQTDGAVAPCSGAHPDAALLAGWAVGGSDTILPSDVGMQMGTNGFTLEVHYNNDQASTADASGVQVCVTKTPREHLAATHWIGTTNLSLLGAGEVNSTCTPSYGNGPITILSSWPHMHKHGTHLKSVIVRAGGQQEMLIDKPFDFNYQVSYPTPAVLNSGDKIATTCTYGSGPVQFGEGTNQEMCFNFIVAWPAGSLSSVGANFTANQCFN